MTRVRFDPSFVEHERWERLGADALVLHVTAVSYSVRTLSDGVITTARLRTLTPLVKNPRAVMRRLLDDGLWQDLGDGGVRVCEVHKDMRQSTGRGDEQPSREFVESDRAKTQARKELWRAKQAATRAGNGVPDGVPNGDENAAQSTATQSGAVRDPEGSRSCTAPDVEDVVRRVRAHRPKWSADDVRTARVRIVELFRQTSSDDEAVTDADLLLIKLATRPGRDRVADLGAFLADTADPALRDLPETPARQRAVTLQAAETARQLNAFPNADDARKRARSVLPPAAPQARIDAEALQLLREEPDFRLPLQEAS
jgi:hypothetical protein